MNWIATAPVNKFSSTSKRKEDSSSHVRPFSQPTSSRIPTHCRLPIQFRYIHNLTGDLNSNPIPSNSNRFPMVPNIRCIHYHHQRHGEVNCNSPIPSPRRSHSWSLPSRKRKVNRSSIAKINTAFDLPRQLLRDVKDEIVERGWGYYQD